MGGSLNFRSNSPVWQALTNSPFAMDDQASQQPSVDEFKPLMGDEVSCETCDAAQSIALDIWPAALSLAANTACATLVFPFFPYIPSSGLLPRLLPQVLFVDPWKLDLSFW